MRVIKVTRYDGLTLKKEVQESEETTEPPSQMFCRISSHPPRSLALSRTQSLFLVGGLSCGPSGPEGPPDQAFFFFLLISPWLGLDVVRVELDEVIDKTFALKKDALQLD